MGNQVAFRLKSIWLLLELGVATNGRRAALVSSLHSRHSRRCPLVPVVPTLQPSRSANRHDAGCGGAGNRRDVALVGLFRARRGKIGGETEESTVPLISAVPCSQLLGGSFCSPYCFLPYLSVSGVLLCWTRRFLPTAF